MPFPKFVMAGPEVKTSVRRAWAGAAGLEAWLADPAITGKD